MSPILENPVFFVLTTLLTLGIYIPQIVQIYKDKSSKSLSFVFMFLLLVGNLCNLSVIVVKEISFDMLLITIEHIFFLVVILKQIVYYNVVRIDHLIECNISDSWKYVGGLLTSNLFFFFVQMTYNTIYYAYILDTLAWITTSVIVIGKINQLRFICKNIGNSIEYPILSYITFLLFDISFILLCLSTVDDKQGIEQILQWVVGLTTSIIIDAITIVCTKL